MASAPKQTPAIRPLAENIPTELARKKGRRIYVTCGYNSRLNTELRQIGAKWDPDAQALWVGTGKADRVLPLVQAHQERVTAVADIKALGLYVSIPYDAQDIRARAKELGALWVKDYKQWAMRTPQDHTEIRGLVEAYTRKLAEESVKREAEEAERARLDEAQQAEWDRQRAAQRLAKTLAAGRTPTGEAAELRIISTRRMNRRTVWELAYNNGDLVQLDDGRRGIVTDVEAWFTNDEMASSVCWHDETHDMAHWDILHTVAVVEPTEEEAAEDTARAEQAADAAELHSLLWALNRAGTSREGYTALDQEQVVGTIKHEYGTWGTPSHDGGTAYLMADGRVVYRHPGYYDDYRATERTVTEPVLVERTRAALAKGARKRTYTEQMHYDYTVTPKEEQQE